MSATSTSVFISRLRQLPVMDSGGDQVGKVRDVVVQLRAFGRPPRAKGLVVELFARQRIFIPMERVHSMDAVQIIIAGVVNTRRFSRRESETLVIESLFDLRVTRRDGAPAMIFDVAMRETRAREWEISEVALREPGSVRRFGRRPHLTVAHWDDVSGLHARVGHGTEQMVALLEDMKAADVAQQLHDLEPARRVAVAAALDDEKLADALQELPEDEQVQVLAGLDVARAAEVLAEMDPDDAADLINELDPGTAEELLSRMEPAEADDVRRLMTYAEFTAGGMMTPEPVIVGHDATVADALALVRNPDLSPALAAMAFVTRPPLETPTGRFLGAVHFQRMLREPPSTLVSALIDTDLEPLPDHAGLFTVARYFATYNLVIAPVTDKDRHLIGAVTVDDVLDHVLPEDWREEQLDDTAPDESEPAEMTRTEVADGRP